MSWQVERTRLFRHLDNDVRLTISGDGTTNTYEAILADWITVSVQWPRSDIQTAEDQEVHMVAAMKKLKATLEN